MVVFDGKGEEDDRNGENWGGGRPEKMDGREGRSQEMKGAWQWSVEGMTVEG